MTERAETKKPKSKVVGFRINEDEEAAALMKIQDENGHQVFTLGELAKAAFISSTVTFVDHELEQYRTFVAAQIGNLRNQLTKALHQDRKAGKVSEETYLAILEKLAYQDRELNKLLEPLR